MMELELIKLDESEVCYCCDRTEETDGLEVYKIEHLAVNVQLCEVCLADLDDEIATKVYG